MVQNLSNEDITSQNDLSIDSKSVAMVEANAPPNSTQQKPIKRLSDEMPELALGKAEISEDEDCKINSRKDSYKSIATGKEYNNSSELQLMQPKKKYRSPNTT